MPIWPYRLRGWPPSARAPQRAVPADLEEICLKALAAAPADRYPSARALHADVDVDHTVTVGDRLAEAGAVDRRRHEGAEAHGDGAVEHRARHVVVVDGAWQVGADPHPGDLSAGPTGRAELAEALAQAVGRPERRALRAEADDHS